MVQSAFWVADLHDLIFDIFWSRNLHKFELFFSPGRLHLQIAETKEGLNRPVHMHRDILQPRQMQFRNRAIEETVLGAVDNPSVGDNPNIQSIHRQRIE